MPTEIDTPSTDNSYVFDGTEVLCTGRTATRTADRKTASGQKVKSINVLIEIKPADTEEGSWHKWVKKDELYEIHDNGASS